MWYYKTTKGTVQITHKKDGRYHVIYDDESLGAYTTPQQAVDDASGGHTFMPSNGVDLGEIGLPYDLPDWHRGNPE